MSHSSHFNQAGEAHIVDISNKPNTHRTAVCEGYIEMQPNTLELILEKGHRKGDVLAVARLAGIMASKKTSELIPLCHPIPINHVEIDLTPDIDRNRIRCQATLKTFGPTGIEMEALTAVQIALLTIYDMCKGIDRGMVIQSVKLLEKQGGQSGHWISPENNRT